MAEQSEQTGLEQRLQADQREIQQLQQKQRRKDQALMEEAPGFCAAP